MPQDVWMIVLTWNGKDDTLDLLDGLHQEPATVLVVDNGSVDGTLDAVRARYPSVRTLQNGANLGYAGGNNAGIAYALDHGAAVVGVLNNDTLVEPGFLAPLLAELATNPAQAVSPDIRYADEPDTSWFRGSKVDERDGWPVHLSPPEQPDPAAGPFASPLLTGCCIVAPAQVWRDVGTFDDGLFLMFEDSDWSMRARARGVALTVVSASCIRHKVSRSFTGVTRGLGTYYFARNGLVFAHRHLGPRGTARFLGRRVLRASARSLTRRGERLSILLAYLGVAAAVGGHRGMAGRPATRLAQRAAATDRSGRR